MTWNREQIYNKSIRSDNSKIKRKGANYSTYSEQYRKKKQRAGKYQGFIDLSFEGGYLDSYVIEIQNNLMYVKSKGVNIGSFSLSKHLKEFYGKNIEGLTDENIKHLQELIINDLRVEILNFALNGI